MKIKHSVLRQIHRDTAYFFLGLIICFSISGIALNHRKSFNPTTYTIESKDVSVVELIGKEDINKELLITLSKKWNMDQSYRGFKVRGNRLSTYYKNAHLSVDLTTGQGTLDKTKTIPILGQMTTLHKSTSKLWIWFSDIFGFAMLIIALTGLFLSKGENRFLKRGLPLAIGGMIFPFLFLFIL